MEAVNSPGDLFGPGDGAELGVVSVDRLAATPGLAEVWHPGHGTALGEVPPPRPAPQQRLQVSEALRPSSEQGVVQAAVSANIQAVRGDFPLPAALQSLPVVWRGRLEDGEPQHCRGVAHTVGGVAEVLAALPAAHVPQLQHQLEVPGRVSAGEGLDPQPAVRGVDGPGEVPVPENSQGGSRPGSHLADQLELPPLPHTAQHRGPDLWSSCSRQD